MGFAANSEGGIEYYLFEGAYFIAFLGNIMVVKSSGIPEGQLKGGECSGRQW